MEVLVQEHGLSCVHTVLRLAEFNDVDKKWQLPIGKLNTDQLQTLFGFLNVAEPGSIRTLVENGLLPLHTACHLHFPDLVIYVLLRAYPALSWSIEVCGEFILGR